MKEGQRILWRATSSRSDWRGGEPLRRVVGAAARLGLIGRPDRVEPGPQDPRSILEAKPGDELAEAFLAAARAQGRVAELTISGADPAPWELYWNVYPFDGESGWVEGLNGLFFTFDRSRVADAKALAAAFLAASSGGPSSGEIEYGMIHPYDHWSALSDGLYEVPVTINVQFRGVSWTTFLGPGHLDEFDRAKLRGLEAEAHEVRWVDDTGLFVLATPNLAAADAPDTEPVLLRLTERFRAALRPGSRWS